MQHESIRRKLLEHKAALLKRIEAVTDDVRHKDQPLPSDFAEQAVERENEEVMDAIGHASRAEVAAIDSALARIETGDYGICIGCGEDIPEARLEVLPYSTRCVNCAE